MYAKIFTQILDSSIADNRHLRHFFMDLLILADQNGIVDITPEAIASRTRTPLKLVRQFIVALEGPDPRSRSLDADGARIARLDDHRDWGWIIINYDRFRATTTDDQYRSKNRERAKRFREKHRESESNVTVTLREKPSRYANVRPASASASASEERGNAKGESGRFIAPSLEEVKLNGAKIGLPEAECVKFFGYYGSNGWRVGRNGMKCWRAAMIHWRGNWQERAGPINAVRQPPNKTYRTITDDALRTIEKFKPNL